MGLKAIRCMDVDWVHAAPNKDQWRAVFNRVMNFRVPETESLISYEELCYVWFVNNSNSVLYYLCAESIATIIIIIKWQK
jgi:hypothetical protein